jgi:tetratricopeptide (TPR) repeat protein
LNYHEYRLAHFAEGIYAEDVDVMIAGESQAQTFHHLALGLIQERQLGPYRWLFGPKPGDSSLDKLGEMARAQRTDPAKVIEIYDSLPKPMQLEKLPMLQRIVAAAHLEDEKLYLEALSAMRKQFPKDPSGMLTSIDTLALLGKFEDCNKAVDELDAYVGGDPYLDLKRAAIAMRLGNRSQAKSLSLKVVEAMPAVVPVHWEAMGIVLEIEDYEQALELLKRIDERFSMEWSDLSQIEVYRGFVQSPQYEEWLKYRREQDRKKARARGVETI